MCELLDIVNEKDNILWCQQEEKYISQINGTEESIYLYLTKKENYYCR